MNATRTDCRSPPNAAKPEKISMIHATTLTKVDWAGEFMNLGVPSRHIGRDGGKPYFANERRPLLSLTPRRHAARAARTGTTRKITHPISRTAGWMTDGNTELCGPARTMTEKKHTGASTIAVTSHAIAVTTTFFMAD